jgi:hypothetical protein
MKEEMEELYAEALATHCAAHRAAAPCQRERLVMAYWDQSHWEHITVRYPIFRRR